MFSDLKGLIWQMGLKEEGVVLPEGEAWEKSPHSPGPELPERRPGC